MDKMDTIEFISKVYDDLEKKGLKRYKDVILNPHPSKPKLQARIKGRATSFPCKFKDNEIGCISKEIWTKYRLFSINDDFL